MNAKEGLVTIMQTVPMLLEVSYVLVEKAFLAMASTAIVIY